MWIYDLETLRFLLVNDAAVVRYGYSREQFLRMTIADIRPQEDVPQLIDNIRSTAAGMDDAGVWRHKKQDGSLIEVEIVSHTLDFGDRKAKLVSAHDITERKHAEKSLATQSEILTAVTQSLAAYVERGDWREAMGRLLRCALGQTQSEYGFIGVVVDGTSLRVLAHEGLVWDKVINRDFYEQALRRYDELGYLEFANFNNLFGRAITTGQTIIANQPDHDPRSSGRPSGHPPMRSFLGVPIFVGQHVQGVVALANRPGGYSEEEQRRIETLVQHAGGLCASYRQNEAAIVPAQER